MKIIEYDQRFNKQIRDYKLRDATFTGLPENAVTISRTNSDYHPCLALTGEDVVPTFFVLDYGKDKFRYTDNPQSMLLRSFSTDDRYMRKGYALKALNLLPAYVRNGFPNVVEIVLGVNRKNAPAQKLYEKAGFKKQTNTYIGKRGEQFIYKEIIK
ncbi:GNAT family N-acetyltransferase [Bifidobacterium aquikefiricola]|uniref:GNAT family protein n=1 Tax=Bifidobacterium aquikefiricola TaxID=3059038 RepID=A0AB39U763_9BIFI